MYETEPDRNDDERLVERLKSGDLGAFDELFGKYRRGLLAYVLGMCRDRGLAEDVVQDAFVMLAARVDWISPKRGVKGWLFRTARNRTIDLLRHRRFEVVVGDDPRREGFTAATADAAPGPDGVLMSGETRQMLCQALDRLKPVERDVLLMHFFGGLTFSEIAKTLSRPLGTVLWRACTSLRKLRAQMPSDWQKTMEGGHDS